MARRLALAAFALSFSLPVLAQQPVYPNFPPPPAPSGDNAPHPAAPDAGGDSQNQVPADQSSYPEEQNPAQNPPDQNSPNQSQQTPPLKKPSPYPPAQSPEQPYPDQQYPDQQQPANGQTYPQTAPYPQQPAPYPQQQPYYPPMADYQPGSLGWVPRGMEALGRTAAFHTDFTFDRTMLQLASGMWDGPMDPAAESAINRLDGISVHVYHYAAPGMYDPRLIDFVRRQYGALGWQHLVTTHSRSSSGATDLWISFHNMRATGAVLLFQSATNLNLIAFSGNLSPLDLLHLRGHFGIPRFSGDRFVQAPGPSARYASPPAPR